MKRINIYLFILSTLLFFGCSSKSITSMQVIKEKQHILNSKNIFTSKNTKLTAYIDNSDKIKFLCIEDDLSANSCKYTKKDDESIFGISEDGYKSLYNPYKTLCGIGSHAGFWTPISKTGWINNSFNGDCNYRYTSFHSYTTNNNFVGSVILSLGTNIITSIGLYNKSFDFTEFRKSINNSKINSYKDRLLSLIQAYNISGGIDVIYITQGDVEDSLEDKYDELVKSRTQKAGVVFLDDDTNELLSIIMFNSYNSPNLLSSIASQIKDIKTSIQTSEQYILKRDDVKKHLPQKIPEIKKPENEAFVKEEFETIEVFNKRTLDFKEQRELRLKELEDRYIQEQTKRTNTINELNTNYSEYLVQTVKDKQILLDDISKNIPLLSKIIFLENNSGYNAYDFKYDAQTSKLFFILESNSKNFKTRAVAKIPADIAKVIKTKNSFLIYPNLEFKNNTLTIVDFEMKEVTTNESFKVSYTNKQHTLKNMTALIETKVQKIQLPKPRAFKNEYKASNNKIYTQEINGVDLTKRDDAAVPDWWDSLIKQANVVCAVADTLPEANINVRAELAAKIYTKITSSFESHTTASNLTSNTNMKEDIIQTTDVELHVDDYEILKQDMHDGRWYVAVRYLR